MNPIEYDKPRPDSQAKNSFVPPAHGTPSDRIITFRPGREGLIPGSPAKASRVTTMWSHCQHAVFEPAFPGRSRIARVSSVPSLPWSTNAHNG